MRLLGSFGGNETAAPAHNSELLKINQPNDRFEQEADAVAEQVMRTPASATATRAADAGANVMQRKCAHCEEDETEKNRLQREDTGPGPDVAPPIVHDVLRSAGQPLDMATRSFMEPRFSHDLSDVRVHTDGRAAESAQAVGALAYTLGDHVVFGQGQYQSNTFSGQKLLAHELTHVLQQNNKTIHRTPDPATLATFDLRAQAIRNHPAYLALAVSDRAVADDIMVQVRTRDNCLYYIDKLTLLFNTPEEPPANIAASFSQNITDEAAREQARLATPQGQARAHFEEDTSASPARRWVSRAGEGGKIFYVDNRDPNNIVVRARVHLIRQGLSTPLDITNIRSYEDAIEKKIEEARGYIVDLEFVDVDGPDIFTVNADTGSWPTSGNWVSDADTLAHELHHLLGLDDRYNYIESHSDNRSMLIPDRLHWFQVQVGKPEDPEGPRSLMGGGNRLLDDDICRVAGLDLNTCVRARTTEGRWSLSALGGFTPTPGLQGLAGVAARLSLRPGGYVIFNPYIGLNVLYSPTTNDQPQGFLTALAEGGLRIQQPTNGAFLDVSGGAYVGFQAPLRDPLRFTGGLTAGIGAGWRWERVEIGVQEQTLFPLTSGDPTQVLVLGRIGIRFGQ